MFFRHSDHRKKPNPILGIFRLIWSLLILAVLGLGLLQAYRAFSGIDPFAADPKSIVKNLLSSESAYKLITGFLTLSPDSFKEAKKVLPQASVQYKFAVVSDSHTDYASLSKALSQAKQSGAKFVIGLGDFSDVGTVDELKKSKQQFDASGLPYYVTAGDHDLWDSRDKKLAPEENFKQVFASPYQAFTDANTRFILIYNSDNYSGLDSLQLNWLESELARIRQEPYKLVFVFSSIPFYHPSSDHVMGKSEPKLKSQAEHLTSIFKKGGVDEIFAGDAHFFSRYSEPVNDLKMTSVGAVTSARNPQSPRFAMVDIFEDGNYNIEDVEIK